MSTFDLNQDSKPSLKKTSKPLNSKLQNLRKEIDKIDDQIISLFAQRMNVVMQVSELKKNNQDNFFIKSGREADMLKELVKKECANFSKATIINIWRKIITTANMHEQKISLAIHNPKNIVDYDYIVREYYSNEVPISSFDSASSVVLELEKDAGKIGIFALPSSSSTFSTNDDHEKKQDAKESWWVTLANNRVGLRVFTKIPFVEFLDQGKKFEQIELVAVAIKEPEKSSEDNSLLYIEVAKEISRNQILLALKDCEMSAKILKSVEIQQFEGIIFHLVELEGFYLEDDQQIKSFSQNKIKPFVKILGHYPTTIKV